MSKLSNKTRKILKEIMFEHLMNEASDLTPEELAENGFKALWEYTDEDLIEEIEDNFLDEDDKDGDGYREEDYEEIRALIKKAKAELKSKKRR